LPREPVVRGIVMSPVKPLIALPSRPVIAVCRVASPAGVTADVRLVATAGARGTRYHRRH
jgi:hypothetical protein